jgi:hypothetical protein
MRASHPTRSIPLETARSIGRAQAQPVALAGGVIAAFAVTGCRASGLRLVTEPPLAAHRLRNLTGHDSITGL